MAKKTKAASFEGFSTKAVHAGKSEDRPFHALVDPIVQTSNYTFDSMHDVVDFMSMREENSAEVQDRMEYGRYGNPTTRAVEKRIAALEHGEEALMVASGMAAITSVLLTFLKAGDHVVLTADCYRKTRVFVTEKLASFGISTSIAPFGGREAIESCLQKNTQLIFSESPTNPYLRVVDVEMLGRLGQEKGILTVIDSTFATPYNLNPLDFGIDLVIHSATKYLAGHNDLLAGVVIGAGKLLVKVRETVSMMGCVSDPHTAFLLQRGLKTLGLRVAHQNRLGQAVAEFLDNEEAITEVWYPGLASHPDHEVAKRLLKGFGGVVSFTVGTRGEDASYFIDQLMIPAITPSLGAVESLVTQPALMSYFPLSREEKEALGIKENLIRLAIGIEDEADVIADLAQALEKTNVWMETQGVFA
jgi:cystathionine gamma-synthase